MRSEQSGCQHYVQRRSVELGYLNRQEPIDPGTFVTRYWISAPRGNLVKQNDKATISPISMIFSKPRGGQVHSIHNDPKLLLEFSNYCIFRRFFLFDLAARELPKPPVLLVRRAQMHQPATIASH